MKMEMNEKLERKKERERKREKERERKKRCRCYGDDVDWIFNSFSCQGECVAS